MSCGFTKTAVTVLTLANQEAHARKHRTIASHHILLALLDEPAAQAMLVRLGANVEKLRISVEQRIEPGSTDGNLARLPLTPKAGEAFQFARDEAQELGHELAGTVHLLLGLMCTGDTIAARVLAETGGTVDALRKRATRLVNEEILRELDPEPKTGADDPSQWLGDGI